MLRKKWLQTGFIIICAIALLGAGLVISTIIPRSTQRTSGPIPEDIVKDLAFSPFVIPSTNDSYKISNYKYSSFEEKKEKINLLSYVVTTADNTVITVNQQVLPPQFIDIPQYKEKVLSEVVNQKSAVPNANGTIYIGTAMQPKDKQIAAMIEKGLIVLMYPSETLDEKSWRAIGDALEVQKL